MLVAQRYTNDCMAKADANSDFWERMHILKRILNYNEL